MLLICRIESSPKRGEGYFGEFGRGNSLSPRFYRWDWAAATLLVGRAAALTLFLYNSFHFSFLCVCRAIYALSPFKRWHLHSHRCVRRGVSEFLLSFAMEFSPFFPIIRNSCVYSKFIACNYRIQINIDIHTISYMTVSIEINSKI
jgi:hypothetical protein